MKVECTIRFPSPWKHARMWIDYAKVWVCVRSLWWIGVPSSVYSLLAPNLPRYRHPRWPWPGKIGYWWQWIIALLFCIFLTVTYMWSNISSSNSETVAFYQHLPPGKDSLCPSAQDLLGQLAAGLENSHIWALKVHGRFLKDSLKRTVSVEKGSHSSQNLFSQLSLSRKALSVHHDSINSDALVCSLNWSRVSTSDTSTALFISDVIVVNKSALLGGCWKLISELFGTSQWFRDTSSENVKMSIQQGSIFTVSHSLGVNSYLNKWTRIKIKLKKKKKLIKVKY